MAGIRFRFPGLACLALGLALLGACTAPTPPAAVNDPFERTNRAWFEANLAIDRAISGSPPAAAAADPGPESGESGGAAGRRLVRNFGSNLGIPSSVVNDLLQLRPDRAMENTLRFAVNSTIGLGGLFDPAGSIGLHGRRTDFGETLHRWGVGEGAYVVLPILGPSTERDALGMVVDALINPWDFVVGDRTARAITAARWAGRFADRSEFADLIDANVMRAADPYAQARLLYLQARRYHLGIVTEDEGFDPYDFLD